MNKGHFFLIIGPSGVGKGIIQKELLNNIPNLKKNISVTTRKKRNNETNSIHYHFITKEEYINKLKKNEILMHYEYKANNEFYGTLSHSVIESINNNEIIIDETDIESLKTMIKDKNLNRKLFTSIFIKVTNLEELEKRINSKNFSKNEIKKRLNEAKDTFFLYEKNKKFIDYEIINSNLKETIDIITKIINSKTQ